MLSDECVSTKLGVTENFVSSLYLLLIQSSTLKSVLSTVLTALATLLHVYIRSCYHTAEHFSPTAVIHNGANKIQLFNEEYTYPVKKHLHQETN